MPAFSTVIMGLYPTVMHSSLRLAALQMERQRGKGTGCHNLASHSGQEPQLQTHTLTHTHTHEDKQARAPTPASTHMNACISRKKQTHSAYLLYMSSRHIETDTGVLRNTLAGQRPPLSPQQQNEAGPGGTLTSHINTRPCIKYTSEGVPAVITQLHCLTGAESKGGAVLEVADEWVEETLPFVFSGSSRQERQRSLAA